MKNLIKYFVLIILIFLFLFFLFIFNKNFSESEKNNLNVIKINDTKINVEYASSILDQARGLSGREYLKENYGMLFIFDKEKEHAFWMKDMNFAIDIIYFNNNYEVVYIKENALPSSYPETFGNGFDSKYVLEVPAFFAKKHNIKLGDKIILSI